MAGTARPASHPAAVGLCVKAEFAYMALPGGRTAWLAVAIYRSLVERSARRAGAGREHLGSSPAPLCSKSIASGPNADRRRNLLFGFAMAR